MGRKTEQFILAALDPIGREIAELNERLERLHRQRDALMLEARASHETSWPKLGEAAHITKAAARAATTKAAALSGQQIT